MRVYLSASASFHDTMQFANRFSPGRVTAEELAAYANYDIVVTYEKNTLTPEMRTFVSAVNREGVFHLMPYKNSLRIALNGRRYKNRLRASGRSTGLVDVLIDDLLHNDPELHGFLRSGQASLPGIEPAKGFEEFLLVPREMRLQIPRASLLLGAEGPDVPGLRVYDYGAVKALWSPGPSSATAPAYALLAQYAYALLANPDRIAAHRLDPDDFRVGRLPVLALHFGDGETEALNRYRGEHGVMTPQTTYHLLRYDVLVEPARIG